MAEKVISEIRFIETDDGFRVEFKGDKERMRKMGPHSCGPQFWGGPAGWPGRRFWHGGGHGHQGMGHGKHGHGGHGPWGWWWEEFEEDDASEKPPKDV